MPRRSERHSARAAAPPGHHLAALGLRLAVGPMLMYHGYNKVAGPGGLAGTTRWFDALGLQPAAVHARLAAATEIGAGLGLTLGAASPLPAAATVGLMTVAARTDHRGKGFFVFKGGAEYVIVVAAVAAMQAALGPGKWSVDRLRGTPRHGAKWAVVATAVGVGAASAMLATSYKPVEKAAEPVEKAAEPAVAAADAPDEDGA